MTTATASSANVFSLGYSATNRRLDMGTDDTLSLLVRQLLVRLTWEQARELDETDLLFDPRPA